MPSHAGRGGTTWALVPVKPLAQAKSRLAPVLSGPQRTGLLRAMLADVLAELARAETLAGIAVITADTELAALARGTGAMLIAEPRPSGLNAAVATGIAELRRRDAARALVLPADIPLLRAAEVDDVIRAGAHDGRTLVVPSRDLDGTNGLLVHLDGPPDFAFGPGSFQRHLHPSRGGEAVRMLAPSFELDIDTPGDLADLLAHLSTSPPGAAHTAVWAATYRPSPAQRA
jgi:2-phospho-L-lactate guanylyltransferase